MKYLKLFEAFESNIMSKTLKYLSKDGKERFFQLMKAFSEKYDYPFSKLNDDFFEYLPYASALKKYISSVAKTVDCKAKSEELLDSDVAVPGDVCTGGKIKRKWGEGSRSVECTKCNGTGKITVDEAPELPDGYELTKIWLDDEGNIVDITYTDGKPTKTDTQSVSKLKEDSLVLVGKVDKLSDLSSGDIIKLEYDDSEALGYFYKSGGRSFFISNTNRFDDNNDDIKPNSNDWRKLGNCSWILSYDGDKYYEKIYKYNSVYKTDVDHFVYNKKASKAKSGWYVKKEDAVTFNELKKAKFAIIFDVGKAIKSEYEKTSTKVARRTEYKTGALAFKKPEDIKKENLDRIIGKLSSKNVKGKLSDLQSLDNYIFRILGGKNILFRLLTKGTSDLEKVIDSFFKLLENVKPDLETIGLDSMTHLFVELFNKLREKGEEHLIGKINTYLTGILGDVNFNDKERLEGYKKAYMNFFSIFHENDLDQFSYLDVESHNESLLLESWIIDREYSRDEHQLYVNLFKRLFSTLRERRLRGLLSAIEQYVDETVDYIRDEGGHSLRRAEAMAIRYAFEEFEYELERNGIDISTLGSNITMEKPQTTTKTTKTVDTSKEIENIQSLLFDLFQKSFTENETMNKQIQSFIDNVEIKWNDKLVLKKMIELSNEVYEKIKSFGKLNDLSDVELVLQKIKSILSLFKNTRWEFCRLGYTDIASYKKKLDDAQKDKVLQSLEELKKTLNRI